MKRRLTVNATAIEKSVFQRHEAGQPKPPSVGITAIQAGEAVEFFESNGPDRVWVKWNNLVWSISVEAWNTAKPV